MKTKRIVRCTHRWIYHLLKAFVAVSLALALGTAPALAEEPSKASAEEPSKASAAKPTQAQDTKALAKASQNPVANLISVPVENNATFNNGLEDVFVDTLNLKPVIPMGIGENWNLINRAIVPIVYQDDGFMDANGQELGSTFGLGDIVYQGFISPKKPGKILWGIGPEIHIPTGMDRLSSDQWSIGPSAVLLTMPGNWVMGLLVSNVWNVGGGYNDAPTVNAMTSQYFINYNMENGWYATTAPVMTANWKADSGDVWTVPIGGGFGRVFKIGSQHVNMKLATYYNVVGPNGSDDVWNVQAACTFLFPEN